MNVRSAVLLCAVLSVGGQALAQCPTSGAPVPQSPIGTNQTENVPINFSWAPATASGVTSYDVLVSTGGPGTLVCSASGANASACNGPAAGLSAGTYNWVVRANISSCAALQSTTKQFTVGCLTSPPAVQSPSDGTQNVSFTPTLTWSAVNGANRYDVYFGLSGSGACTGSPQFTTSTTSFSPTTLAANTTYEWRVVAKKTTATSCPTTTSSCATFKTATATCNPPGSFNLTAPANTSTASSTPTLTWSAASGADKYVIHVSTQNPPTPTSSDPIVNGSTTQFTFGQALPAGTYYWQVDAYPPNCTTSKTSSSVFSFTVAAAAACPTAAPTLITPAANATVSTAVSFDWSDVSGATFYRLFASINGGTAAVLAVTNDSHYNGNLPAGASVDWWAEAAANNCTPVDSAHSHFNVSTASCPSNPGSPTLVSPANGSTGLTSPVTFQWTAVSGATNYVVWGTSSTTSGSARFTIGSTPATQLTATLPQGGLAWYVEADFGDCPTATYSKAFTLSVSTGATCGTTPATLLAPANAATGLTSPVTFKWTAVPGASGYKLYVADANSSGDLAGTTTATSLTTLVPGGTPTWWVVTTFAGCPDVMSAKSAFTVGTQATCGAAATLASPADGAAVTSPVTLSWSAVNDASGYRVWISYNGGPPFLAGRTNTAANTSLQVHLTSGADDEWYVETLFSNGCDSTFSAHRHFTINPAANCDTHKAATLTSPIGGALVSTPVTFNWSSTDSSALQYRVWVSIDNEPFADIGSTKDTKLQHDFAATTGNGQWFVETLFENCPAVFSAKANFVIPPIGCGTAGPQLIAPADGSIANAPLTFIWSAVTDATEYRLIWTLNGNNMPALTTTETSITHIVSPGPVEWHVEATFDGCPTTRSTKSRFTIPPAPLCSPDGPVLTAPADGATNLDSPVRLDWNPVSNAIGYTVFLRHNDGVPTELAQTTTRTVVTKAIPEGTSEWWVVAFFNGCPPAESKHASFSIPLTTCDNARPILFTPANNSTGLSSPVHFAWSRVEGATQYKVWAAVDDDDPSVIGTTTVNKLTVTVPSGTIHWHVEVFFNSCPSLESATSVFAVRKSPPPCGAPDRPKATAPAQVASNTSYTVRWSAVLNSTSYELQESSTADFSTATTQVVTDLAATFVHTAAASSQKWRYRVRAISSCDDERGPYSRIVIVTVLADAPVKQTSIEIGTQSTIRQTIFIPGHTPPLPFTARTDKPWATVTPSSGTLGPQGVTLTIVSDPTALKLGTNTATVILTFSAAGKDGVNASDTTPPASVPVSVTTVTPVSSGGRSTPLPSSLIIPAVGHANGANNSLFESDLRIANITAQAMTYQLNFTLTATDGTQSGQSTTIQVSPGSTMALDDILTSFFGDGSDGSSALGTLEIRPLTTTTQSGPPSIQTVASSRTYNSTPTGTFGQFIPAIPFSQFIGQSPDSSPNPIISLQQIAQSAAYRTNFGIVEGSGEPANVLVHVFNNQGTEVVSPISISLLPGEHVQRNLLAENNITLTDGRFEVEVVSPTGKVTAYASVIDNLTNDPLMVFPVLKGSEAATRYVIPGVADINNGFASWRSDIRLFNPTSAPVTATLTYFPQPGNAGASGGPKQVTIPPNQVMPIDNALQNLFTLTNSGGSMLVTTPASSKLIVTARTYNQTSNGTYGQFIPAVTPAGSVGLSDNRILQLLQLESSDKMRTNIGFVETSGNPVTIEVSAIPSDSKVAAKTQIPLAANQFLQVSLAQFGLGTAYNARVTVKVLSGTGRVTAYGSVIDAATQDPTYVPAQ